MGPQGLYLRGDRQYRVRARLIGAGVDAGRGGRIEALYTDCDIRDGVGFAMGSDFLRQIDDTTGTVADGYNGWSGLAGPRAECMTMIPQ